MSPRAAVELVYLVLAGCFFLIAGYQFRNVSASPSVRRWLVLGFVCLAVVLGLRFL